MSKHKTTLSIESNTRKIEVRGRIIIYTLKYDGGNDYFTYNETLLKILQMDWLRPYRQDDRLRVKIRSKGDDEDFSISDIAFGCYHEMVNFDTFMEDMGELLEYKRSLDLQTDHADDNHRNNTIYNLSLMRSHTNKLKNNIVARLTALSLVIPCYIDGRYRVYYECRDVYSAPLIEFINQELSKKIGTAQIANLPPVYLTMKFVCNNPENLVLCLKQIAGQGIYCDDKEIVEPMRTMHGWRKQRSILYTDNILSAIKEQERIANMDIDEFDVYPATNLLGA